MSTIRSIVITPTAKSRFRAVRPLLVILVIAMACGLAVVLLPTTDVDSRALSTTNTTESGARALARVIEAHGVDVHEASGPRDALARAEDPDTTLVVAFPGRASPEVLDALRRAHTVVWIGMEQAYTDVDGLEPVSEGAQIPSGGAVSAGSNCSSATAERAATITKGAFGVRASGDWSGCYDLGNETWAYAERDTDEGFHAVIADSRLVRNSTIDEFGDAALAIGAIARTPHVVWYIAEWDDTLSDIEPATPAWMIPLLLVLVAAGLAAALAQGRRLGRLVPEDLPSPIPASETVIGRGRLLHRSHDRGHAARALRAETARRLGRRLGVPPGAPPQQLHAALVRGGIAPARAQVLLWGPAPASDRDLVDLATELARLEEDIHHD